MTEQQEEITQQQYEKKVLEDFMRHEGWKIMSEKIDKKIDQATKMLTGEAIPETVQSQFNKLDYNYYDLIRFELRLLKDIKNNPKKLVKPNVTNEKGNTI